jgi:hypothetical protein
MVKVACYHPNGVMLNLFKPGFDDGTGVKQMIRDGVGHRLNGPDRDSEKAHLPGITEVPDAWMAEWLKQNELNPMVAMNHIYVLKEGEEPNPTPPPAK